MSQQRAKAPAPVAIECAEVAYHCTRPSGFRLEGTLVHPAGQTPAGPVVVFIHGTMSSRDHNFVPDLCQKLCKELGVRSYRFDARFDASEEEPNHRYSFSGYADDMDDLAVVIRTLRKDGFVPFVLFGHSRGSNDALLYASSRLQRSSSGAGVSVALASEGSPLASSAGGEGGADDDLHLLDADRLAIVAAAPRFHMHLMPACIFSPEQLAALDSDEGRFAWPAAGRAGGDRLHVTRADVDVVRAVDMARAVAAIPEQVPVLLLHGTDDELIPVADAQEFAAARKSIEVCIVDGARHAFRGKKPLKQLLTTATAFIGDAHRKFFCQ